MSFHLPICERVLEAFPDATTLFGKPMPTEAVRQAITKGFFAENPNDLDRVTWLVDTETRVEELGRFARSANVKLRICLETDVGLHRGGFDSPAAAERALNRLAAWPELSCVGFMGYDAHANDYPAILGGPGKELVTAQEQFRNFANILQHDQQEIMNTGGSSTVLLYGPGHPANDVTVGSAVIKPADFDVPGLADLVPAAVIAAPILKLVDVDAPGLSRWTRVYQCDRTIAAAGNLYLRWKMDGCPGLPGRYAPQQLFWRIVQPGLPGYSDRLHRGGR